MRWRILVEMIAIFISQYVEIESSSCTSWTYAMLIVSQLTWKNKFVLGIGIILNIA